MNRRLIIRVLGAILLVEAAAMLPALFVSLIYNDGDTAVMGLSVLIVSFIGTLMLMLPPPLPGSHLRLKEGFIITALGWITMSLCGALPFFISGIYPRFEDAFFESVSGFTTTGASVLTRFEGFPHGIMLWRATTHWVGGMGVLVLTLALLPKLTGRTAHLVKAESPGPSLSKLVPQTGKTAKILYSLYIGLTLCEFISLLLCGVTPYDAIIHTFGTAGTGGFSNFSDSVRHFDSVSVDIVISVFMFLFGCNFALYYKLLFGEGFKAFFRDEEFRWYLSIGVTFILLITLFNLPVYGNFFTSLRYGSFQLLSVMSTTGFVTADFNQWPVISQMLLIITMFIGACAGSTAGGMKVIRINIIAKMSRRNIQMTGNPKRMDVIRLDGKAVDEGILSQVAQFALMYVALVLLGAFLISLEGKFDITTNLSAALTCVSNVGPGLGAVGPTENFASYGILAKIVLSFLMLFGRLELLPMFILFTRSAWRKY